MSQSFDMIGAIDDNKESFKLVVWIVDRWFVQVREKSRHLEMVLMDGRVWCDLAFSLFPNVIEFMLYFFCYAKGIESSPLLRKRIWKVKKLNLRKGKHIICITLGLLWMMASIEFVHIHSSFISLMVQLWGKWIFLKFLFNHMSLRVLKTSLMAIMILLCWLVSWFHFFSS